MEELKTVRKNGRIKERKIKERKKVNERLKEVKMNERNKRSQKKKSKNEWKK